MVKRERKIDIIDLPVVKRTIKKYDNFETVRQPRRRVRTKSNFKLYIKIFTYTTIFMSVAVFKMTAVFEVTDLNQKIAVLNKEISESELIIDDLNYSYDSKENLKEVEKVSKQLGFVDNRDIRYVRFN